VATDQQLKWKVITIKNGEIAFSRDGDQSFFVVSPAASEVPGDSADGVEPVARASGAPGFGASAKSAGGRRAKASLTVSVLHGFGSR
jgi:hypothetical protein